MHFIQVIVLMRRLSYPTETVLSTKITKNHSKTVPENHKDGDLGYDYDMMERNPNRVAAD